MIIQNVSRKTHILSFLRRKKTDAAIVLNSGQAIDLATKGFKDEELANVAQLTILINSGEIKKLEKMPEISKEAIENARIANRNMDRERIIEKVRTSFAVTLIESYAVKAKANKDDDLYRICQDRLNEIYGVGISI